jgi:hypothetical protein
MLPRRFCSRRKYVEEAPVMTTQDADDAAAADDDDDDDADAAADDAIFDVRATLLMRQDFIRASPLALAATKLLDLHVIAPCAKL